jgi:hypothetical protein
MAKDTLTIGIAADPSAAIQGFRKVDQEAAKMAKKLQATQAKIRDGIGKAGLAVAAGTAFMLKGAISAAQESQKIAKVTESVVKSTGGAANVSVKQVGDLATELSNLTGIDDELIQSSENVLLTFTKVRNEVGKGNDIFTQAEKAALDMSTVMGGDLQGTTVMLGKALNDPIKGLQALTKNGVTFTADQKEQVKALVATGDTLAAQKLILKEVNTEFGGAAAASATNADRAKVAFGNLQEAVGGAFLPIMESGSKAATGLAQTLAELPGPVQQGVVGLGLLGGAATFLAPKIVNARDALKDLGLSNLGLASALGGTGVALSAAGAAAALGGVLLWGWAQDAAKAKREAAELQAGIDGIRQAMEAQNITAEEATRQKLVDMYVDIKTQASEAGLSVADLGDAVTGSQSDFDAFIKSWTTLPDIGADNAIAMRNVTAEQWHSSDALAVQQAKAASLIAAISLLRSEYVGASAESKTATAAAKALGLQAGDVTGAVKEQTPKVKTLAEKWADVASAVDDASDKLKTIYGLTTDGIEARIAATAAMMEFTAGLKDNGVAFNENSKAGQDNYKNIIAARDAAESYADSLARKGDITGAIRYMADYSKVLEQQAVASGVSKDKAAELIETLGLTPEQIVTFFGEAGYKEVKQKAIDLTNNANAAAAKRFLNWVANTKDPEKKAMELGKIADNISAKRYLDWVANTATPKQKADQLKIAADEAARKRTLQINVNGAQEAILAMQGIQTQKNLIDDPVTISVGMSYASAVGVGGMETLLGKDINGNGVVGRASGGMTWGGWTKINERGPEIVRLPKGSEVLSATRTRRQLASSTDRPIVVHNYITLDGKVVGESVRTFAQDREAMTGKAWTA